jgi:Sec-independent protein translocase protein TatA
LGQGIKNFKKSVKDDEPEEVAATEAPKKVDAAPAQSTTEAPAETTKQA